MGKGLPVGEMRYFIMKGVCLSKSEGLPVKGVFAVWGEFQGARRIVRRLPGVSSDKYKRYHAWLLVSFDFNTKAEVILPALLLDKD